MVGLNDGREDLASIQTNVICIAGGWFHCKKTDDWLVTEMR